MNRVHQAFLNFVLVLFASFGSIESSFADPFFVVKTEKENTSESLNRISGDYDLGFSSPNQSYKSESSYSAGGLGRKEPAQ